LNVGGWYGCIDNIWKYKRLPVVLSQEVVSRILSSVTNLKHRLILMFMYSAGLRVREVVKLKILEHLLPPIYSKWSWSEIRSGAAGT